MSTMLDKLHAVAVRAGVDPLTGCALDRPPSRDNLDDATKLALREWTAYIKRHPENHNSDAAKAFAAGFLSGRKSLKRASK